MKICSRITFVLFVESLWLCGIFVFLFVNGSDLSYSNLNTCTEDQQLTKESSSANIVYINLIFCTVSKAHLTPNFRLSAF